MHGSPEFVSSPEPGLEKKILAHSLMDLRDFRAGRLEELVMSVPDEGMRSVVSPDDALRVRRALRGMWSGKYPELFNT